MVTVEDVMNVNVVTVSTDATISEVFKTASIHEYQAYCE